MSLSMVSSTFTALCVVTPENVPLRSCPAKSPSVSIRCSVSALDTSMSYSPARSCMTRSTPVSTVHARFRSPSGRPRRA